MNKRDIGIDIIKFFAALMITNSHMGAFYPQGLSMLATGGALGDALFFFCSGFTLFLKPMGGFLSWYKKRISRIYPTVFAKAIIFAFIFGYTNDMKQTILQGGGWFISCIMIYYVIAYLIDKYMSKHLNIAFFYVAIIVIISYILWDKSEKFNMYGETYFKWVFFFLAMLLGAIVGKNRISIGGKKSIIIMILSVLAYYSIVMQSQRNEIINTLQILSLVPLFLFALSAYTLFNCAKVTNIFKNKYINWVVMFVGGLCLEIYLVQSPLLKIDLGLPFPINYVVMLIIIIVSAYILRCGARIFLQTFNKQDYNWKEIFKAI